MFLKVVWQVAVIPSLDEAASTKMVVGLQVVSEDAVPNSNGRLAASEVVDEAHRCFEAPIQLFFECCREAVVVHNVAVGEEGHHDGLDQLSSSRRRKYRRKAPECSQRVEHLLYNAVHLRCPRHVAVHLEAEVRHRAGQLHYFSTEDDVFLRFNHPCSTENDRLCLLRVWMQAVGLRPACNRCQVFVDLPYQLVNIGLRSRYVNLQIVRVQLVVAFKHRRQAVDVQAEQERT